MQIIPKEEVLSKLVKTGGVPLDISLIIFDSTSAANFQRNMPNTSRLVIVFVVNVFISFDWLFASHFCL